MINGDELWRTIPPEEKLEIMAKSQAQGVIAVFGSLIVLSTLAVSLQWSWMMWGALIVSPWIFQFNSSRTWRAHKPRVMLSYLAARAAARRYAYIVKSEKLSMNLIFRGTVEHLFDEEQVLDELEADIQKSRAVDVWITLFDDAVVLMSEKVGGAALEFGHVLNDKLKVIPQDSSSEYSSGREIIFEFQDKDSGTARIKVTSKYPAAMVVFERRVLAQHELLKERTEAGMSTGAVMLDSFEEGA